MPPLTNTRKGGSGNKTSGKQPLPGPAHSTTPQERQSSGSSRSSGGRATRPPQVRAAASASAASSQQPGPSRSRSQSPADVASRSSTNRSKSGSRSRDDSPASMRESMVLDNELDQDMPPRGRVAPKSNDLHAGYKYLVEQATTLTTQYQGIGSDPRFTPKEQQARFPILGQRHQELLSQSNDWIRSMEKVVDREIDFSGEDYSFDEMLKLAKSALKNVADAAKQAHKSAKVDYNPPRDPSRSSSGSVTTHSHTSEGRRATSADGSPHGFDQKRGGPANLDEIMDISKMLNTFGLSDNVKYESDEEDDDLTDGSVTPTGTIEDELRAIRRKAKARGEAEAKLEPTTKLNDLVEMMRKFEDGHEENGQTKGNLLSENRGPVASRQ